MFYVRCSIPGVCAGVIKTVYAVDRATNSFLIDKFIGGFEWVSIDNCEPYEPEDEG